MRSRAQRENTTRIIRENIQQLNRNRDILAFLKSTGHLNDGYVFGQLNHILEHFFFYIIK